MTHDSSRRDFIRSGAALALGAALPPLASAPTGTDPPDKASGPVTPFRAPPMERVRIGFVGVGGQGSTHVDNLLDIPGAELHAICDIVPEKVTVSQQKVVARGFPEPKGYSRGPRDFERMCAEQELDLVFTATPWEWHVPVMLAAMANGKHAATEVPAAMTLDDCWAIVEAAEKHQKHCLLMENCSYDRFELMTLNLVRQGLLGELLHGEAAYLHDLRGVKFSTEGEGLWRRAWSTNHNGNLYPTHGLGPIANCMDINRGDRFERVVSMSSPSKGLQLWQAEHLAPDDPRRTERYILGDVNLSLIQTARGRTIYLAHNTNNPRPYSRLQLLQGTRGLVSGWPYRVHLEGRSPAHQWEEAEKYYEEFDHPLWRSKRIQEMDRGHGGMDFLEDYRLIGCLLRGEPTDMNVYDAAALSSMVELTIRSVAQKGKPQEVPDFTRGRWRSWQPWPIVES
jgi:Glycosyl hydrolase 109, C-terminal domain/Oxidoreductase family, NAD-binding Rossmann fold